MGVLRRSLEVPTSRRRSRVCRKRRVTFCTPTHQQPSGRASRTPAGRIASRRVPPSRAPLPLNENPVGVHVTSELKLFGDLLFQLWVSHEKPWAYSNGEATEIYRQIGDLYRSFERREELEAFIPSHSQPISNFASTKRFLYLNPCEGQPTFVPVLSLKCDFDRPQPEIRLRVGLFLRDQGEIRAIGLRFESPEGEDEGIHHYYHAQYITYFYDGAPLKGAPPWLPITQPAMALEADGPVGLL